MIHNSVFVFSMAFNLHKRYKQVKLRNITSICVIKAPEIELCIMAYSYIKERVGMSNANQHRALIQVGNILSNRVFPQPFILKQKTKVWLYRDIMSDTPLFSPYEDQITKITAPGLKYPYFW